MKKIFGLGYREQSFAIGCVLLLVATLLLPLSVRAQSSSSAALADLKEFTGLFQEFTAEYARFESYNSWLESRTVFTASDLSAMHEILRILTRMLELQKKMESLRDRMAGYSTSPSSQYTQTTQPRADGRENLTLDSVRFRESSLFQGPPEPEQLITVTVRNNQFGSYSLSNKKVEYSVRVYECLNESCSRRKSTSIRARGEFLLPYANGYSEFQVYVEGGSASGPPQYENGNARIYQARIDIDTGNDISESDERDNTIWTGTWKKYYKG